MRFVREISEKNLDNTQIDNLEQEGFTIIWKEDSIEIWVDINA